MIYPAYILRLWLPDVLYFEPSADVPFDDRSVKKEKVSLILSWNCSKIVFIESSFRMNVCRGI